MIITYQENQLLNASSSENIAREALLFQVLDKICEVEHMAMRKLQQTLKPAQFAQFLARIAHIKSRSPYFNDSVSTTKNIGKNNSKSEALREKRAGFHYYTQECIHNTTVAASIGSNTQSSTAIKHASQMTDIQDLHINNCVPRGQWRRYSGDDIALLDNDRSIATQAMPEIEDTTQRKSLFVRAQRLVKNALGSANLARESTQDLPIRDHQHTHQDNQQMIEKRAEVTTYPLIAFNQRGRTAGIAYLERWEIRLNPILLVENSDDFIREVIPHEYAHLLVFALFGKVQPHGKEWQMMMTQIMGLPANRTHQFNTDSSVTRQYQRFTYRCECKDHALTTIRHNRIQAGKAQYHCKSCGSALTYIPENLQ